MSAAGVDAYVRSIGAIPVLDADTEHALALRVRERRDPRAAQRLILSNLRFVVHVASSYLGYGLPLCDLIQEGNIGLIRAVQRFAPMAGVRLISYAVFHIRAQIHEFILSNWKIVKLGTTKAQRKLFFNLRKYGRRAGWLNRREVLDVAHDLKVDPREVLEMETRMKSRDCGIVSAGVSEANCVAEDALGEGEDPIGAVIEAEWVERSTAATRNALEHLDKRSRDIVARRFPESGPAATLEDLAADYAVSAERVRQIQNQALRTLRCAIEQHVGAAA